MGDRGFNILSVLCLAAIVGVMSWRSMHPHVSGVRATQVSYYAGDGITPANIPADNSPITIGAGTFSTTADGGTSWTPHGMPPATIAQRQINLQFRFNGLPRDPARTIKRIEAVAQEWRHKGDIVNVLVFDYSPAKPDLAAYNALIRAANAAFTKEYTVNPYSIYPVVNLLWADKAQTLEAHGAPFVIRVPEAQISPQLFARLSALQAGFILQFPRGAGIADIGLPRLRKLTNLRGVTLTLDPHRTLPVDKDAVGLFPKL